MSYKKERYVIALGGNALLLPKQKGTIEEKESASDKTAGQLSNFLSRDYEIILTHGNGPQVGNILIQNEEASSKIPPMPLDVCVADSQGEIGYILQKSIQNDFKTKKIHKNVITVLTQVLVDKHDLAFNDPTKPVGPFYTKEQAVKLISEKNWIFREDPAGKGFRRVVASPKPIKVLQCALIEDLITKGHIVICVGGGGIPVSIDENHIMYGEEAVIDKDLASSVLASELNADKLIILTNIDACYIYFKKPNQIRLKEMNVDEAMTYLEQEHFSAGSMGPKVMAAVEFVNSTGNEALITSIENLDDALQGKAGTVIKNYF